MKVEAFKIHNFRSIRETELVLGDLTALVGPNNAGKSNLLRALEHVLSPGKSFAPGDYSKITHQDDLDTWIEATFTDLQDHEVEALSEWQYVDGSIHLRKISRWNDKTRSHEAASVECMRPNYPGYWFLSDDAAGRMSSSQKVSEERDSASDASLRTFLEDGKRKTKDEVAAFQKEYVAEFHELLAENVEAEWHTLPTSSQLTRYLPEVQFVPAVLSLEEELKTKQASIFGKLTTYILGRLKPHLDNVRQQFEVALDGLETGEAKKERDLIESRLKAELEDWSTAPRLSIKTPDVTNLISQSFVLSLDDGTETPVQQKGHGLQRATFFALIRTWAALASESSATEARPVLLMVEEPELYLHPHAQRRLHSAFTVLANRENIQILQCTHSGAFMSLESHEQVRRISKTSEEGTKVYRSTGDPFATLREKQEYNLYYWMNPHRSELFFAERVVLVEGQTEMTMLPLFADALDIDASNWTFIDCNGKGNIVPYVYLLNGFSIPYVVVHDEDPVSPDLTDPDRLAHAKRINDLNSVIVEACDRRLGKVVTLSPDFEGQFGVSRAQAEKHGKALASLRKWAALQGAGEPLPQAMRDSVDALFNS